MLRIRDVYPKSRILIFIYPGSRIQKQEQKSGVKINMLLRIRIRDEQPGPFFWLFLWIRDGKKSDPWFGINIPDLTHCLFMSPQISPNLKYKIGDIFGSRIHGSKLHQIPDPPLIHYHPWFIIMNPTSLLQNVRHRRSISNTSEWCPPCWRFHGTSSAKKSIT